MFVSDNDSYSVNPDLLNPLKLDLPSCLDSQKLLVTVISTASEISRRNAIRKLWGSSSKFNSTFSTLVFITGRTEDTEVLQEARIFNDLVITDIKENYYNLTLKTYAALRYSGEYCPYVECIVKADSDNVVHIREFENLCRKHIGKIFQA